MNVADIVILLVLALPAMVGVVYGFLNIVFSILAWALALGVAAKFTPVFASLLETTIHTPIFRNMVTFAGLFIISLLIFTAIGFIVVKLLGRAGLTATDRILGLFFGMGLGGFIVLVVVFLAGFTALPSEAWWERSLLLQPFERVSIWAERFLPNSMTEYHGYHKQSGHKDGGSDKQTSPG